MKKTAGYAAALAVIFNSMLTYKAFVHPSFEQLYIPSLPVSVGVVVGLNLVLAALMLFAGAF